MRVVGYKNGVPLQVDLEPFGSFLVERDTLSAYYEMLKEAKKEGLELKINSAFRAMDQQERLLKEWEEGKRKIRPARPGFSKHQLGTALDINRSHDDPDGDGPLLGKTDVWLRQNAAKFGFYATVPGEPWHWEFVGLLEE